MLSVLFCDQRGQQSPQFCNFSFLFCWLLLGLVFWPRLGDPLVCQSSIGVYACHFLWQVLGCAYTICSYGQISISCTSPSGSPCPTSRVKFYIPSALICCIRLLYDWWFHLCQRIAYISYFVASYLFLLWYDWFLRRCFVFLLGEILFLSKNFLFIAMSRFCHVYYYYYYYYLLLESPYHRSYRRFSHQRHLRFSDSKFPQVSRTFLGILVNHNNTVVLMVSIRLFISKSSSPFINPLVTASLRTN